MAERQAASPNSDVDQRPLNDLYTVTAYVQVILIDRPTGHCRPVGPIIPENWVGTIRISRTDGCRPPGRANVI